MRDPPGHDIQQFLKYLRVLAPGARRHVERMIRVREQLQRRARAEPSTSDCNKPVSASSSRVPCRNSIGTSDVGQVRGALVRRLARRMQRKSEEHQAAHARQRRSRLRLRRHAAAEGLAAREQRQPGQLARGFGDGRAHGRVRERAAHPAACDPRSM